MFCQKSHFIRFFFFSLFLVGWGGGGVGGCGSPSSASGLTLWIVDDADIIVPSVSAVKQNKTFLHLCAKGVILPPGVTSLYQDFPHPFIILFYRSVIIERKPMTNFDDKVHKDELLKCNITCTLTQIHVITLTSCAWFSNITSLTNL